MGKFSQRTPWLGEFKGLEIRRSGLGSGGEGGQMPEIETWLLGASLIASIVSREGQLLGTYFKRG